MQKEHAKRAQEEKANSGEPSQPYDSGDANDPLNDPLIDYYSDGGNAELDPNVVTHETDRNVILSTICK